MGWSLGTAGVFGRIVGDCALFVDGLLGTDYLSGLESAEPPKIALCRTQDWPDVQPDVIAAVDEAGARLANAGAKVRPIELPPDFSALRDTLMIILAFE